MIDRVRCHPNHNGADNHQQPAPIAPIVAMAITTSIAIVLVFVIVCKWKWINILKTLSHIVRVVLQIYF